MHPISLKYSLVAPFAGAWVETIRRVSVLPAPIVAPFAGAWVETVTTYDETGRLLVAPFAGAWVETTEVAHSEVAQCTSRPSRARGLKRS